MTGRNSSQDRIASVAQIDAAAFRKAHSFNDAEVHDGR